MPPVDISILSRFLPVSEVDEIGNAVFPEEITDPNGSLPEFLRGSFFQADINEDHFISGLEMNETMALYGDTVRQSRLFLQNNFTQFFGQFSQAVQALERMENPIEAMIIGRALLLTIGQEGDVENLNLGEIGSALSLLQTWENLFSNPMERLGEIREFVERLEGLETESPDCFVPLDSEQSEQPVEYRTILENPETLPFYVWRFSELDSNQDGQISLLEVNNDFIALGTARYLVQNPTMSRPIQSIEDYSFPEGRFILDLLRFQNEFSLEDGTPVADPLSDQAIARFAEVLGLPVPRVRRNYNEGGIFGFEFSPNARMSSPASEFLDWLSSRPDGEREVNLDNVLLFLQETEPEMHQVLTGPFLQAHRLATIYRGQDRELQERQWLYMAGELERGITYRDRTTGQTRRVFNRLAAREIIRGIFNQSEDQQRHDLCFQLLMERDPNYTTDREGNIIPLREDPSWLDSLGYGIEDQDDYLDYVSFDHPYDRDYTPFLITTNPQR